MGDVYLSYRGVTSFSAETYGTKKTKAAVRQPFLITSMSIKWSCPAPAAPLAIFPIRRTGA